MGAEPGGLNDLGPDGKAAWDALVARVVHAEKLPPHLRPSPTRDTPERSSVDWTGYPERVEACIGRAKTHRLLDWRGRRGLGGRQLQEEYAEWRVARDADGKPRRIEMTTELAAYWEVLAAHRPDRTAELVSAFAGHEVDPATLYGRDPEGMDPRRRRAAFLETMAGPYNDGAKAICFMAQPTNTLVGIVRLAARGFRPCWVVDPHSKRPRPMSGSEAIAAIGGSFAQDCRNSDPLIVERLVDFATEGRRVALDDPVGVYITGVARHCLTQPDGSDVPKEWFELSRGNGDPDRPLFQRLTFEVPEGEGSLADLIHEPTGEKIRHGAQIAELVQLALYLRTSPPAARPPTPQPQKMPRVEPCHGHAHCAEITDFWREVERS